MLGRSFSPKYAETVTALVYATLRNALVHNSAEGAVSDAGVPALRGRDPNRKGLLLHQAGHQGAPYVCRWGWC